MANGQLLNIIHQIAEELNSEECRRMFYLCGVLDTDSCVSDVRGMLKSRMSQGQMDHVFLIELLFRMRRFDILKKVLGTNKQEAELQVEHNSSVSEYRVLMADVSEDMGTDDLQSVKFLLCGILPREKLDNIKSFLDIVVELEKVNKVSSERVDFLEQCLRNIQRVDLVKKINQYQKSPHGQLHEQHHKKHIHAYSEKIKVGVAETGSLYCQSPMGEYRMQATPRGLCVIIDCVGSDGDMLEQMFSRLHFRVFLHKWLSVAETLMTLREVSQLREHQDSDAFACCIISRGTATDLLATESHGMGLRLGTVKKLFTPDSCAGLAGKPKLFFIQSYNSSLNQSSNSSANQSSSSSANQSSSSSANQSSSSSANQSSSRYAASSGYRDEDLETDGRVPSTRVESVPICADIFWSQCWTDEGQLEGNNHHSVYMQALSAALLKGHRRKMHLVDVHTDVNGVIYDHNQKNPRAAYSIDLRHTLRKNLFIL